MRERIVAPLAPTERVWRLQFVERAQASLGRAFETSWGAGRRLTMSEAVDLALQADTDTASPVSAPSGSSATAVTVAASGSAAPAHERTPVTAPPPPAAALVARTLGALLVTREGEPIEASAWGSARVRELLIFLLAHPTGCSREQIGAALWPEASTEQVRNSFHVTLHRLRKALGHADWIVVHNERYQLEPSLVIDFDAARFERDATAALGALGAGQEGAGAALATSLSAYEGDFLQSESAGDWHLEFRERLQRLYVEGQLALGAQLTGRKDFAAATDALHRAIGRDTLHEGAWRMMMTVQARAGERAQAMRTYQRFTDLLKAGLGAEPDEATARLFERIRSGDGV